MTDLERRLQRRPTVDVDPAAVTAALAARADADGLLDIAWDTLDSPLGELAVFLTPRGLVRLSYGNEPMSDTLDELSSRVSPRILRSARRTDRTRRELDAYFEGRLRRFETPVDWSLTRGFARGVLAATARIPFGETASYGEVAAEAGSPRAARAAGNALSSNPIPIVVPCHRIIHAGGGIGGYTGGLERKRFLLRVEGISPSDRTQGG
jgi:methylated-DNA-[protein]-cysteine S-methyltransferase